MNNLRIMIAEPCLNIEKQPGKGCQDSFLIAMKNKCVTIFLINGVKLKGVISDYDNCSLLLSRDDNVQLIYKNAISTMMPYMERV